LRVVLADDCPDMRALWRHLLTATSGFEIVAEAADGRAAIDVCRAHQPDAVVLDWAMPVLDGMGVARVLRSEQPHLVIVVCSAYHASDLPAEPAEVGVTYLEKLSSARLPEVLTRLLTATAPVATGR